MYICCGSRCVNQYGMTSAVGTGIFHIIGGVSASTAHLLSFSGVGGTSAVGDGDMMYLGVASSRSTFCQAQVRWQIHLW